MFQSLSRNLWNLARDNQVPESYHIWGQWCIQDAIVDKREEYTDKADNYQNRMTDTEKAVFGEMQFILKDSDTLEEAAERLNYRAEDYEDYLENGEFTEALEDTSEHGEETIPGLYRDVLRKANQEFQETKYRIKQYEAFNP